MLQWLCFSSPRCIGGLRRMPNNFYLHHHLIRLNFKTLRNHSSIQLMPSRKLYCWQSSFLHSLNGFIFHLTFCTPFLTETTTQTLTGAHKLNDLVIHLKSNWKVPLSRPFTKTLLPPTLFDFILLHTCATYFTLHQSCSTDSAINAVSSEKIA